MFHAIRPRRLRVLLQILLLAVGSGCVHRQVPAPSPTWTLDQGAPVRGDTSKRRIALIFTGGDYGEGTPHILDALADRHVKASFFVTGGFLRNPGLAGYVRRAVAEGHYIGPHSDTHPLYCAWEDRSRSLVSRKFFKTDLRANISDLKKLGGLPDGDRKPVYFIPPYEWYNADHVAWARGDGVLLFNFTPGSGSNRDYAPEGHKRFVPSEKLIDDILAYERKDPHGLNGFLLLLHLGSQRKDKVHPHLARLLDELAQRGYTFVRVDEMLDLSGK
jgi:peptidoglycan/xylan/chitin deacetylase (PgdA/CDA1 family)